MHFRKATYQLIRYPALCPEQLPAFAFQKVDFWRFAVPRDRDVTKGADNPAPAKGMQQILGVAFGQTGCFCKLGNRQKPVALDEE
jgi:hypothetical protein